MRGLHPRAGQRRLSTASAGTWNTERAPAASRAQITATQVALSFNSSEELRPMEEENLWKFYQIYIFEQGYHGIFLFTVNFASLPEFPCLCFKVFHGITQHKRAADKQHR